MKIYVSDGNRTSDSLQSDTLDRLATGTDDLLRLKLLQYSEVKGNAGEGAYQNSGKNDTQQLNI